MTTANLNERIEKLQEEIGLPMEFFWKLLKEDDWSFVIKLHALVEAIVNHLIIKKIGLSQLGKIIPKLQLNNDKSGRLAFLEALNLLNDDQRSFIKHLSEIRNDFVHDIKKVNLTLKSYFEQSSKERYKKTFGNSKIKYEKRTLEEIFIELPKTAIFITS
ncbi:MAG: hypothetical protein ABII74_02015 [Elusimicrobiota bacterium]